jgi:dihydrofolate reductase
MKISVIAAMAKNRVIGMNNQMPWHLSADLKRFKAITMSSPIIMGRKTFESIGKPLPGRTNIVITRNPHYLPHGCLVFNNLDTAIERACQLANEIFVIGGAELYRAVLSKAETIYLTEIIKDFPGDTFFPDLHPTEWREQERLTVADDESVDFDYSFVKLERR